MFWPHVGRRYLDFFNEAVAESDTWTLPAVLERSPDGGTIEGEKLLQGGI
jgi:hypothetical protein